MSNTPRTDTHQNNFNATRGFELDDVIEAYELARTLERENQELREVANKLAEAGQLLHDYQNGCPLPSYHKHWDKAMLEMESALAAYQSLSQGGKG